MVEITVATLLFIEAADNYAKFHFAAEGKVKTEMLRMTMKEVEKALENHAHFYRCHRSFVVNGQHITEVQGSSQSHKLKLTGVDGLIPVSRSFNIQQLTK